MDRSFLSAPEFVAISRDFVCVRLLTYENAEEGEFLKGIFRGRTGQLENSVFAILDPEGNKLTRGGRSPHMVFGGRSPDEILSSMVTRMKEISARYQENSEPKIQRELPYLADVRRGLNAAACDIQPLVVVVPSNNQSQTSQRVKELAWSDEFVGTFAYVQVANETELQAIEEIEQPGVYVVQPDAYGLTGRVLAGGSDPATLAEVLRSGSQKFKAKGKNSRRHIRQGLSSGKHWEPEIPVTDPHGPKQRETGSSTRGKTATF